MSHQTDQEPVASEQSRGNALDMIACPAPHFSEAAIRVLLREQYGLQGDLKGLVSERDQNVRITTAASERYVLKIANETEDPVVTDFQIRALLHLEGRTAGVSIPKVIRTRTGDVATSLQGEQSEHVVRLVSYLPGMPLADVQPGIELAASLGECLAQVGLGLSDFAHPGEQQVLMWDMQRAGDLRGMLPHITETDLRTTVTRVLDHFECDVQPNFSRMRRQVIHNDLNPENALVGTDSHSRVTGIIDFGDMVRAPLIVDVAIAASYLRAGKEDLLTRVQSFVVAYDRIAPLEDIEFELLHDLIRTRIVTTITILRWRLAARGKDDPYLHDALESERGAEHFLLTLGEISASGFADEMRKACGR